MPTLRPDKGNRWLARVVINGKQITCKMFPPGKKFGPQWRAAKNWEEEELAKALQARETRTDLDRLMAWGNGYLSHAKRTMSHKTYVEKQLVMREFFNFCGKEGVTSLEDISSSVAHRFLVQRYEEGGANVANKYRKNLLAAWTWGLDFVEGFPQVAAPFRKIPPFSVTHGERYVPPEEDVIKVLHQARGQDLVMLLTLFYTGARRGEVFRLTWQDVNLPEGKLRLRDHKTGNGRERVRWLRLHPELVKALSWWNEARPCCVENVFMWTHCDTHLGEPFQQRRHDMRDLRERAGVKPFGFHAIRHKSAAIAFMELGLNAAQILMGHYRATTTDRYIKCRAVYGSGTDRYSSRRQRDWTGRG